VLSLSLVDEDRLVIATLHVADAPLLPVIAP